MLNCSSLPINAFNRNQDGTIVRDGYTSDIGPPSNGEYQPPPNTYSRNYNHYTERVNSKINGQNNPNFEKLNQQPQEVRFENNSVRLANQEILNGIKTNHPSFNPIFFSLDEGLCIDILLQLASYFFLEREFFNILDLINVAEGCLELRNEEESDATLIRSPFYVSISRKKFKNLYKMSRTKEDFAEVDKTIRENVSIFTPYLNQDLVKVFKEKIKTINNMCQFKDLNVVHGFTSVSDLVSPSRIRDDGFESLITCKTTYYNHCKMDLTVVERSGMRQVVKHRSHGMSAIFVVRKAYVIRKEGFSQLKDYFHYLPDDSLSNTMKVFKKIFFDTLHREPHCPSMTVSIDNSINEKDIVSNGGSIYFLSEDVLVSDQGLLNTCAHPFNSKNFNKEMYNTFSNAEGDVGINFEIIDNTGFISERYVMIANTVYKLKPKKDSYRENGLYVTVMERDPNNEQKKTPVQKQYPLDNLELNFGIYKTIEEAQAGGDVAGMRKEAIAEMENTYKIELQKYKNISLELEKESKAKEQENKDKDAERIRQEQERKDVYAERERLRTEEIQRLQLNNKFLEADIERQRNMMREYYERKSYDMKNTSEIMKWIPTMVNTLLVAFGMFYVKSKTS